MPDRLTPPVLRARLAETARALGCPEDARELTAPGYVPGSLRLRRSGAGYSVELLASEGGAAWALADALTAREADAVMLGLRAGVTVAAFLRELEGEA